MTKGARARLNAAAPALLGALKAYVVAEEQCARNSFSEWQGDSLVFNDDVWERNDPVGWPLVVAARAAIAKAEGR